LGNQRNKAAAQAGFSEGEKSLITCRGAENISESPTMKEE